MHQEDQVVKAEDQAGQAGARVAVPEAGMPLAGGCALFASNM